MIQGYFGEKCVHADDDTASALMYGTLLAVQFPGDSLQLTRDSLCDSTQLTPILALVRENYYTHPHSENILEDAMFGRFIHGHYLGKLALGYAIRSDEMLERAHISMITCIHQVFEESNPQRRFREAVLYAGNDFLRLLERKSGVEDKVGALAERLHISEEDRVCPFRGAIGFTCLAAAADQSISNSDLRVVYEDLARFQAIDGLHTGHFDGEV